MIDLPHMNEAQADAHLEKVAIESDGLDDFSDLHKDIFGCRPQSEHMKGWTARAQLAFHRCNYKWDEAGQFWTFRNRQDGED